MLSKQQSKYFAYELTRLDKTGKLGGLEQARERESPNYAPC